MWLPPARADLINARRRQIAGPTGCGLCGVDSIAQAVRPAAIVPHGGSFSQAQVMTAMQSLAPLQEINIETRAVHAAAFWTAAQGIVALREDVGRHNALDKVVGWAFRAGRFPLRDNLLAVSGRLSFELVQKAATAGAPFLVGVGAPSSLAVELAEAQGVTLCGWARRGRVSVYTHAERITPTT